VLESRLRTVVRTIRIPVFDERDMADENPRPSKSKRRAVFPERGSTDEEGGVSFERCVVSIDESCMDCVT